MKTVLNIKPDKSANRIKIRHLIQIAVFITTLIVGMQYYLYIKQAMGTGQITIPRPASVEGFLPIGALMSWKRFLMTAQWDTIHPAAMVIFGFAALLSFTFHKAFCSWFCPVGSLSEWLWKLGERIIGRNFKLPFWLDISLRSLKYMLLGFFLWAVFTMSEAAISQFIHSPYYKLSDVKMLRFFTHMSLTTGIVLVVLTIGSIFVKNFWCRYFCPYGALTGLLGMIGPTKIKRNPESCIECEKCTEACPHAIKVHQKRAVYSAECSACLDCALVCPVQSTLHFRSVGMAQHKKISSRFLAVIVVLIYAGFFSISTLSGNWQSQVPETEFRELLSKIDSPLITHPGMSYR